ncbi:MAG: DUF6922 domain-containing protein [Bacillota bacterium]
MPPDPLPEFTHPFFWDINVAEVDPARDYFFVIERIMEYGNDPAIRWLISYYGDERLKEVMKASRKISKKTASLWQNYYDLPPEEIRCLNKSFQKTDKIFWNY